MTRSIPFPVGNMSSLYDWMFTYDEHSGAGNTGWIQLNDRGLLEEQNRQYVRYMKDARAEVENLFSRGLSLAAQPTRYDQPFKQASANEFNLLVYNGLSWSRTDVVQVKSPHDGQKIVRISDAATKQSLAFDTDANGQTFFLAKVVPSFGYKTITGTTATGQSV